LDKKEAEMYHILRFSRIKHIKVEECDNGLLMSICYLKDNVQEIEAKLLVEPPELEIKSIEVLLREGKEAWQKVPEEQFHPLLKSRIGPGIFKMIKSHIQEPQLSFILEECCRGIILSFTKQDLLSSPRPEDDEEAIKYYAEMVKENVRLYGRCAAFSKGSRIVEEIEAIKNA